MGTKSRHENSLVTETPLEGNPSESEAVTGARQLNCDGTGAGQATSGSTESRKAVCGWGSRVRQQEMEGEREDRTATWEVMASRSLTVKQ